MMDMQSIKEIIQYATLGIPKGMKKSVSISSAFSLDVLIRNEGIISKETENKKLFAIILHVE